MYLYDCVHIPYITYHRCEISHTFEHESLMATIVNQKKQNGIGTVLQYFSFF